MAASPPPSLPDLKSVTVLIVDDDNDALEVLSAFFEAGGARVLVGRNAAAGLAYLDTAPKLDAVVTDLAMPDMDGIEFARRLRRHPSRKQLPVIAVTALLRDVSKRSGIRCVAEEAGRHRAARHPCGAADSTCR